MAEHQKLDRFYSSLNDLQGSFDEVRRKLAHVDTVPEMVLDRLASYQEICDKQRAYGTMLRLYLIEENFEEVARCISMINGLSVLMLEDVPDFIYSLEVYDLNLPISNGHLD
jgi:hypothetical protein